MVYLCLLSKYWGLNSSLFNITGLPVIPQNCLCFNLSVESLYVHSDLDISSVDA